MTAKFGLTPTITPTSHQSASRRSRRTRRRHRQPALSSFSGEASLLPPKARIFSTILSRVHEHHRRPRVAPSLRQRGKNSFGVCVAETRARHLHLREKSSNPKSSTNALTTKTLSESAAQARRGQREPLGFRGRLHFIALTTTWAARIRLRLNKSTPSPAGERQHLARPFFYHDEAPRDTAPRTASLRYALNEREMGYE